MPLEAKLEIIATQVYGAAGVELSDKARAKLDRFTALGFGHLPICVAKTPMSFTADPKRLGAPENWTLPVTDFGCLPARDSLWLSEAQPFACPAWGHTRKQ